MTYQERLSAIRLSADPEKIQENYREIEKIVTEIEVELSLVGHSEQRISTCVNALELLLESVRSVESGILPGMTDELPLL